MNSEKITIKDFKRVLEFYQELGFEYLPIKTVTSNELQVAGFKMQDKSPLAPLCQRGDGGIYPLPDKDTALKSLREKVGNCQRCKLFKGRTNIVFGEGSSHAEIMFIGEGPGRDEDLQARPFVGDAGKLLTRLIEKMGFKREDVYIANIVKCRPPMNRDPEEDEINACRPFVEEQIRIIKPLVIISLGRISAQSLINTKVPISRLRGRFYDYGGIPLMPTFHPAYLLRNPKDKQLTWEDAQKVLEKLKK